MDVPAAREDDSATAWFADRLTEEAFDAHAARGQAAMVERSAPAGYMTPLHRRDETEIYRVLDGEVTFHVGDDIVVAGPGAVVVAPPHAARTLRVGAENARWLVLTRVRSLARFVDFGRAVSEPLPDGCVEWPSASEHATVASLAAVNGIEVLGPPGVLPGGCEQQLKAA